jgi:cyclohexanone monooxygenase
VIGTGATGVQAIPVIAQQAKRLTVFQRTPSYCVPARNGKVDPEVVRARKADYPWIKERIRNSHFGFEYEFITKSALEVSPEERERVFDEMWDKGGFAFWLANYRDMLFSEAANEVCAESIQIHGGVGFTWDCDAHLHYRRAKAVDLMLGYQGWHRQRVADLVLG